MGDVTSRVTGRGTSSAIFLHLKLHPRRWPRPCRNSTFSFSLFLSGGGQCKWRPVTVTLHSIAVSLYYCNTPLYCIPLLYYCITLFYFPVTPCGRHITSCPCHITYYSTTSCHSLSNHFTLILYHTFCLHTTNSLVCFIQSRLLHPENKRS